MADIEVASFSTKGQIAVSSALRKRLGIKPGTRAILTANGRGLLITPLEPPKKDAFIDLIRETQAFAEREGITQADLKKAIKAVRREKSHS